MQSFAGICLILGAQSDIGEALAYRFAQAGYTLLLAARNTGQALQALASDLRIRHEVAVHICAFDATDYASHRLFYQQLPGIPDVVVSSFGYLGDQKEAEQNFAEAQRIIETNFVGNVSILNTIACDFEQRGSGTLIGISSVAGQRGRQSNYIYGASKGAFSLYLAGLRNRLFSSGVHVMTVMPGFVATKMTAHLSLPPVLTAEPGRVANTVFRSYLSRKNVVYVLPVWRIIMLIIGHIPESLFKRLKM